MIKYFSDTPTLEARAVQIWQILTGKAYNRQITTYREIADILGYEEADVLAGALDRQLRHIMFFCSQNKLPPLTVLVVNGDTDLPGKGFKTKNDLRREREDVFKYNWFSIYPPTASEFAKAYEVARKNNWKI